MEVTESVMTALWKPSPATLFALGASLRSRRATASADEQPALDAALGIAEKFYTFLSDVQAKTTAEEYNKIASMLDVGSVGTVALQNLLAEREHMLRRLLMGGLSEALMLAASFQYVKAWEREAQALHEQAAWHLSDAFWGLSLRGQPNLGDAERRRTIDGLVRPCFDQNLKTAQKTVYVGWLYQFALLTAFHYCQLEPK